MRFPNAYRGVKKIWLAEMLMLLAAIVGIVLLIVVAANGTMVGEDGDQQGRLSRCPSRSSASARP